MKTGQRKVDAEMGKKNKHSERGNGRRKSIWRGCGSKTLDSQGVSNSGQPDSGQTGCAHNDCQ